MNAENFVQWLALGPMPLFALFVGFVVALDVFVVEFTRDYAPEHGDQGRGGLTLRMKQMALTHAALHSLSFLVYTTVIALGQNLAFLSIDLFDFHEGVGWGFLNLLNFLIIIFIWWTYRNKIKEDHSEKDDPKFKIDRGDMRFFVDLLRAIAAKIGIGDGLRGLAIAGSVAVDMLAISALLKNFLLPVGNDPPLSKFQGVLAVDLVVFAAIIFAVVYCMVIAAQGVRALLKSSVGFIFFLRIVEPLAVFYILTGSVRAFAQMQSFQYDFFVNKYGIVFDFVFSMLLTFSLFVANKLTYSKAYQIFSQRNSDTSEQVERAPTLRELFGEVRTRAPFIGWGLLIFVLVIGCLARAYSTGERASHNHLLEATGIFATIVLFITIVMLYLPIGALDRREIAASVRMASLQKEPPSDFWFRLGGTLIALAAVCMYSLIVFGAIFEVWALIAWSSYLIFAWGFYDLRRWRFAVSGGPDRMKDANSGELISAIGMSSSIVAIVAHAVVTELIGV